MLRPLCRVICTYRSWRGIHRRECQAPGACGAERSRETQRQLRGAAARRQWLRSRNAWLVGQNSEGLMEVASADLDAGKMITGLDGKRDPKRHREHVYIFRCILQPTSGCILASIKEKRKHSIGLGCLRRAREISSCGTLPTHNGGSHLTDACPDTSYLINRIRSSAGLTRTAQGLLANRLRFRSRVASPNLSDEPAKPPRQ